MTSVPERPLPRPACPTARRRACRQPAKERSAHDDPASIPYPRRGLPPRRHRHAGRRRLRQVGDLEHRGRRQQPGRPGSQVPRLHLRFGLHAGDLRRAQAGPQGRGGRLLPVGEGGQPVPDRRDPVHQGRGEEGRRQEAAHHQRAVPALQADQRHPGHAGAGRPVPHRRPAQLRRPGARAEGGGGQEGARPHHRPQGQLHRLQGLCGLPRLRLRRAGQARGRRDDQGHRRQGQGRDPARHLRQQRHHRPHQGLRRPGQGRGARPGDRRPADR